MTAYVCVYCGSKLESPTVAHAQQAKRQVAHNVAEWIVAEARWCAWDWRWGDHTPGPFPWEVDDDEVDE